MGQIFNREVEDEDNRDSMRRWNQVGRRLAEAKVFENNDDDDEFQSDFESSGISHGVSWHTVGKMLGEKAKEIFNYESEDSSDNHEENLSIQAKPSSSSFIKRPYNNDVNDDTESTTSTVESSHTNDNYNLVTILDEVNSSPIRGSSSSLQGWRNTALRLSEVFGRAAAESALEDELNHELNLRTVASDDVSTSEGEGLVSSEHSKEEPEAELSGGSKSDNELEAMEAMAESIYSEVDQTVEEPDREPEIIHDDREQPVQEDSGTSGWINNNSDWILAMAEAFETELETSLNEINERKKEEAAAVASSTQLPANLKSNSQKGLTEFDPIDEFDNVNRITSMTPSIDKSQIEESPPASSEESVSPEDLEVTNSVGHNSDIINNIQVSASRMSSPNKLNNNIKSNNFVPPTPSTRYSTPKMTPYGHPDWSPCPSIISASSSANMGSYLGGGMDSPFVLDVKPGGPGGSSDQLQYNYPGSAFSALNLNHQNQNLNNNLAKQNQVSTPVPLTEQNVTQLMNMSSPQSTNYHPQNSVNFTPPPGLTAPPGSKAALLSSQRNNINIHNGRPSASSYTGHRILSSSSSSASDSASPELTSNSEPAFFGLLQQDNSSSPKAANGAGSKPSSKSILEWLSATHEGQRI